MIKTAVGTNPDGSTRFHYELTQEEHDDGYVALLTGPISGTLAVPDGTGYDVSEGAVAVRREHVGHLHVAILKAHHAAGRFLEQPVPDLEDVSLAAE